LAKFEAESGMAQIRHKINEYFSNHLKILYFRYLRMEYDKLRAQQLFAPAV